MSITTIHPKSAMRATSDAITCILELDPPEISKDMVADKVLETHPQWKSARSQVENYARDMLRAMFDFGALRDEADTLQALDPAKMTDEEIEQAANRLREIGEIFNATADALAAERNERFPDPIRDNGESIPGSH